MKLAAAAATHQGQVRENNEDAYLIDDQRALFAVADGMGGHRGGEVASRTAIEALRAAVASGQPVTEAIRRANDAVLQRAAGDDTLTGMGTTTTAVLAGTGNQLVIGHVGDSRAYLLRAGALSRLTNDHSLVEELVREGRLTPEQAESHPQRAIVTRALGIDSDVDVDEYVIGVLAGDRLVLCSDGLTTMVRERDIDRVLHGEKDPQHAADALVDAANAAGGDDNITVVVIDVLEVDPTAEPAEATSALPIVAAASSEVVAPPPAEPAPAPARRKGTKLRTFRGALYVLVPLLLIIGLAAGVLGWYARHSYYVGANGNEVVIYQGVPGGLLGWDPTVEERTGIQIAALQQLDRDRVHTNTTRGSLQTAQNYVQTLRDSVTTTTTTTTTTVRPRTTTTRPKTATTKPTTGTHP